MYAQDKGSPPLLTHVTVHVAVEDENDHAPTFGSAHLSLEVPEGQDPQTLTTLRASDPDVGANGQLQYRILGEHLPSTHMPSSIPCPSVCQGLLFLLFIYFFFFHVYICNSESLLCFSKSLPSSVSLFLTLFLFHSCLSLKV